MEQIITAFQYLAITETDITIRLLVRRL